MKPDRIILECVTGSQSYNLATPESDIDIKGVYVSPTTEFLGLGTPAEVKDHVDPDWVYYELKKFISLCLKNNPTVMELLWEDEYIELGAWGKELIEHREKFLHKGCINAYLGYALQQVRRKYRNATDITSYRAGKHVRHTWRLCKQYEGLALTGKLKVKLSDEERAECFAFMEKSYQECLEWFLSEDKRLREIGSVLPDKPDYEFWDKWLQEKRLAMLGVGDFWSAQ